MNRHKEFDGGGGSKYRAKGEESQNMKATLTGGAKPRKIRRGLDKQEGYLKKRDTPKEVGRNAPEEKRTAVSLTTKGRGVIV